MPQQDVNTMLAAAKGALAEADTKFPSSKLVAPGKSVRPPTTPSVAATGPAKPAEPTLADELKAKKIMMDKARQALPKMHNGGPVMADGAYQLKAGEHVLTAPEATKARKHALMASGLKSLAKATKQKK